MQIYLFLRNDAIILIAYAAIKKNILLYNAIII